MINLLYYNYRLIAVNLSKQKVSDGDSRLIQQIIFTFKTSQAAVLYYIYERSKETIRQFSKGTTKLHKWLNIVK